MKKINQNKQGVSQLEGAQGSKGQLQENFQSELYLENVEKRFEDFKYYLKQLIAVVGGVSIVVIGLSLFSFDKILSLKDEAIKTAKEEAIKESHDAIQGAKEATINALKIMTEQAAITFRKTFDSLQIELNNKGIDNLAALEKKNKDALEPYWAIFKKAVKESGGKPSIEDINKIPDANAAKSFKDELNKGEIITEKVIDENRESSELSAIKNNLQDKNSTIRSSAAKMLASYKDRQVAVNLLSKRLEEETDWLVRYTIVESLGKIGTEETKNALIKVRDQKYGIELEEVRNAAKKALQNF